MKILIIYDSQFGNTQKIAEEIGKSLPNSTLVKADQFEKNMLQGIELLIAGSPTWGGQPTPALKKAIAKINNLQNIKVAAFDTRMNIFIAKIFRYAADKIAKALVKKGGRLTAKPEGFFVTGKEGPIRSGGLERAAEWAKEILKNNQ